MMVGLSNIDPIDRFNRPASDHEAEAFKVYVASLRSGQNVKYLTCCMPDHWTCREARCNGWGSIVGFDGNVDYSLFWREFDKLNT